MKDIKRVQTHCGIVLGNFYLENYFLLVLFDRNPARKKKKKLDLRQSETSLRKCKLIFYFYLRKIQINISG